MTLLFLKITTSWKADSFLKVKIRHHLGFPLEPTFLNGSLHHFNIGSLLVSILSCSNLSANIGSRMWTSNSFSKKLLFSNAKSLLLLRLRLVPQLGVGYHDPSFPFLPVLSILFDL